MRKGGGRGRIGKIIGRHVDGLDGRDGSLGGRRDALLQGTKIGGEGWLVPDGGRDAAQKGRHLGARLGEAEDVVDEEERILALDVTEVLGDGESGQSDTGACTRARSSGRRQVRPWIRHVLLVELDDATSIISL